MGESFGAWQMGLDAEVIRHVTSANIACGFHAGDPATMRRTVALAEAHGVGIGAHPGFPDLQGFGRRNLAATPDEVRDDLVYQIGALQAFTRAKALQHVKPHGALYNMAVPGGDLARAIGEAILEVDPRMILVVLAGSPWADQARRMGLRVAREAFADRALNADGTLVPRSKPGSVIRDPQHVIERSVRLVTEGTVVAITGEVVSVRADTLCLHGDTPDAVTLAAALRAALERAGVVLAPLGAAMDSGREATGGGREAPGRRPEAEGGRP
jgi:UPF0271 protein